MSKLFRMSEDLIQKYFNIAFGVRKRSTEMYGVSPEVLELLASKELSFVVGGKSLKLHIRQMQEQKFISAGNYSITANKYVDQFYEKFQKRIVKEKERRMV